MTWRTTRYEASGGEVPSLARVYGEWRRGRGVGDDG